MLGKLIKHEFNATARYFLPMFCVILLLTPLTKLTSHIPFFKGYLAVIPGVFITLYVFSIIGISILSSVLLIIRFYKNLVTREGYLMHTLPVTPTEHILSKLLVSIFWTITSLLVIMLSLSVLLYSPEIMEELSNAWDLMFDAASTELGSYFSQMLILFGLLSIVGIVFNIIYVYFCISVGQLFTRHRILGAVAVAIVIQIAFQVVSTLAIIPISILGQNVNDPKVVINWILYPSLFATIILTIGFFFGTSYVLKKKLNLE